MGFESQSHRTSKDAYRNAALNNIDKHIQNPTIKEGRITKPVIANPRSGLGRNVHTLSNEEDEGAGLENTHLDYDHSKRLPSQAPYRAYAGSSFIGNQVGGNASNVSSAFWQGKSNKDRAVGSSAKEEQSSTKGSGYKNPSLNPFQALAQGVKKSGSQLPHLRTHSPYTSIPNAERSKVSTVSETSKHTPRSAASSKVSEASIPPHLRDSYIVSKAKSKSAQDDVLLSKDTYGVSNLEKQVTTSETTSKPSTSMNAGLKEKSAAKDSAYPCSYPECTQGFSRAKDLKRHKLAEHDWCSVCNIDCEDDVALIGHRIASTLAEEGKHMACLKCGDDFHCEAGRTRHEQLAHREVQQIKCPGCAEIFERAAGLLAHISHNKCKDRSGLVSKTTLSKGRVDTALEMERLMAMSVAGQFVIDHGSIDDLNSSVNGSHTITQSLLDRDDDKVESEPYGSQKSEPFDGVRVGESANRASDAGSDDSDVASLPDMDRLSIAGSRKTATTQGWTKALFPDAQPTPNRQGWTQPKAPSRVVNGGRGASNDVGSVSIIDGKLKRTDWDYYVFDRDPMGRFICPFQRCDHAFVNEGAVKSHLISGYHQGTNQQCVKCFKVFKTPVALLAHMESASTKCNVRDTQQYGHILYMVSGGFVDVNNDEKGTRLADGQLRMRAPTKTELAEQQVRREEEQRKRQLKLEPQW